MRRASTSPGAHATAPSRRRPAPTTPRPTASDVFVAKLDPTGSTLLYSTFIGNSGNPEEIHDLAVDGEGNAYIIGATLRRTIDYPTTPGAFDTTHNGLVDAFVTKLDATGSALVYSTLLGGSGYEEGWGHRGRRRRACLRHRDRRHRERPAASRRRRARTTPPARGAGGHGSDAFVAKLEADGSGLAVQHLPRVAAATTTARTSPSTRAGARTSRARPTAAAPRSFPTTPGAFDTTHNGGGDPSEEIPARTSS